MTRFPLSSPTRTEFIVSFENTRRFPLHINHSPYTITILLVYIYTWGVYAEGFLLPGPIFLSSKFKPAVLFFLIFFFLLHSTNFHLQAWATAKCHSSLSWYTTSIFTPSRAIPCRVFQNKIILSALQSARTSHQDFFCFSQLHLIFCYKVYISLCFIRK